MKQFNTEKHKIERTLKVTNFSKLLPIPEQNLNIQIKQTQLTSSTQEQEDHTNNTRGFV